MARTELHIQCGACSYSEPTDIQSMIVRLRQNGRLAKIDKPEPAIVRELFSAYLKNVKCPSCKAISLVMTKVEIDPTQWGEDQKCQSCGQHIPSHRLEVFPDATHCALCQDSQSDDMRDHCPQCGGLMTVQQATGRGITRYSSTCLDCGFSD